MARKLMLHHAIVEFSADDYEEVDAVRCAMTRSLEEIERYLNDPMAYAAIPMLLPNDVYQTHF